MKGLVWLTCTEVRGKDSIGCSRDDLLRAEKGGMLDFVFLLPYSRLIEKEKQQLFATDEDSFFFYRSRQKRNDEKKIRDERRRSRDIEMS